MGYYNPHNSPGQLLWLDDADKRDPQRNRHEKRRDICLESQTVHEPHEVAIAPLEEGKTIVWAIVNTPNLGEVLQDTIEAGLAAHCSSKAAETADIFPCVCALTAGRVKPVACAGMA